jgi:hypothetical protein
VATRDVFSELELELELAELRGFPGVSRTDLIRYFTRTPADELFVREFRGQGNALGAAVQLRTLPWLGFVPGEVTTCHREQPVSRVVDDGNVLGFPSIFSSEPLQPANYRLER